MSPAGKRKRVRKAMEAGRVGEVHHQTAVHRPGGRGSDGQYTLVPRRGGAARGARAQIASLTQTRDTMVKLRTALKNKVNNLCSAKGVNLNKESFASEKGLRAVLEMLFDPLVNLELKIIIDQIRSLNQSIAELEETIGKEGQKLEGHKNLTSIKGIGRLSAGILLSIIGDIGDFSNEGKLAAYFGIVPRISNSNETEHSGRITKRGTKLGRTTLVQCALIAQRYSP